MKKWLSLLLLGLLVFALPALAEGTEWYELNDEGRVLTVRFPLSSDEWEVVPSITEPEVFELITAELAEDGQYAASFKAVENTNYAGPITLSLLCSYKGSLDSIFSLDLTKDQHDVLTIDKVEDPWYAIDHDDGSILVVLPENPTTGYTWHWESSDAKIIDKIDDKFYADESGEGLVGVGGARLLAFQAGTPGEAHLNLRLMREGDEAPIAEHVFELEIGEEKALTVIYAE